MEEVRNETANFMTFNPKVNKASTSGTGVGNSSMYGQSKYFYEDDLYDDVDFDSLGLTEYQMDYAKAFDIKIHGKIR